MRRALFTALSLAMLGCASPPPPPMTAQQVLAASMTKDAPFDNTRTVSTPAAVSQHKRGGGLYVFTDTARTALSISQDKRSGTVIFLLTATVEYGGRWRIYRTASLVGGVTLVERLANRQVQSCRGVECEFFESVVFELPPAAVRASGESGVAFRLNADIGPGLELFVPPAHVAAANRIADQMLGASAEGAPRPNSPPLR